MPKFRVDFQIIETATDGSIEVEADTLEAAKRLVENYDLQILRDHTSGYHCEVDVYTARPVKDP